MGAPQSGLTGLTSSGLSSYGSSSYTMGGGLTGMGIGQAGFGLGLTGIGSGLVGMSSGLNSGLTGLTGNGGMLDYRTTPYQIPASKASCHPFVPDPYSLPIHLLPSQSIS